MKCPKCQVNNREGVKFCEECGAKMEIKCPSCQSKIPLDKKFCGECGHNLSLPSEPMSKYLSFDEKLEKIQRYLPKGLTEKILSQRDRIEGERKQVTVMFCDMEGFTSFSERIGPEEAYSIMDKIYEILIHKVHDFEGTVNEMTGDGIMALFGAPIALEDAPQRAIRSALDIHRKMAKFTNKVGDENRALPIKMRIGIHTGTVVVGTLGNDLRVEFKVVGDTVNLASRMEEIAESGTTYVTEETYKLTEGLFRFEGLGDREIKGKEKPIKVYRVLAPSTRRTRFDVSSELGLTPFVGRERELELLLDGFDRAKTGIGQAFSIVAEAGLGKSRLLYEFRKAIASENVTFLEGKSLSYSRNVAYHSVIDILKSNFRIHENDGDFDIRNKVERGLKVLGADEASTLPYLLELLSVKESGIDKILLSAEAKRHRIMDALKHIVLKGSESRPLIMAIEDLHWSDKSSEESLKYLLENISGANVMLIFTYRPEFIHTWGGKTYHSQINLNRLSNRESLKMLTYLLGTQSIDRKLEELILEKTDGVPFFVEELIKSLKDLKAIEKKDNTYFLTENFKVATIPSRIQDVIMARVDSLPEGAKKVLLIGSVIGREFSHELLKKIIGIPEQELLAQLSILKDSEFIYERGIYPKSHYIFKHALTQEAAYHSLIKSVRQKYHQAAAEILEKQFVQLTESEPELLGYHFTEADLPEKATQYWLRAAHRAMECSAYVEAVEHLRNGLATIETYPDNLDRIKYELALQIELGKAVTVTKGLGASEAEQALNRARELCHQVGESPQLFDILFGLRRFYFARALLQKAQELCERLLELAHKLQDNACLLEAHRLNGSTLFCLGEINSAKTHLDQALLLYDKKEHHRHSSIYGIDPGVASLSWKSFALWILGYPNLALSTSQKALTLADELSHAYSSAMALAFALFLHQFRGEVHKTQEGAEVVVAFSNEQRFPYWTARGTVLLGWSLVKQAQGEEGIKKIRHGIDLCLSTSGDLNLPYYFSLMAESHRTLRQIQEGLRVLMEALTLIDKTGERFWEAELIRQKGELLLAQSKENHSEAESCFQQALGVARRQQAKSLELRAAMSLSRLWQSQGKKEEARSLLLEIYGWFTEGFDTADLKDAKGLLDELS